MAQLAESLFATLECELLDRNVSHNHRVARMAIFEFIETFYNNWRRHSSNGNVHAEFERRWHHQARLCETG